MDRFEFRHARHALLAGTTLALALAAATPASAQFFGGLFGGWREAPMAREGVIPPRFVAGILQGQGFRLAEPPLRRGDRIIALGVDERGQTMRFVLDAYNGAIIRSALVGATRPPGYFGDRETYAYGTPGAYGERDSGVDEEVVPVRPKPKPKARVAAKPPATALPGAVPASPGPLPSEPPAVAAPVPVAPVAPPAAAAAPEPVKPTTAAKPAERKAGPAKPADAKPVAARPLAPPQTRSAPDAQPADIGPKVVPVRPAEARAPEPAPPVAAPPVAPAPPAAAPASAASAPASPAPTATTPAE